MPTHIGPGHSVYGPTGDPRFLAERGAAPPSPCLAPGSCRYQAFERAIMQLYRIAFAFHGKPQDIARQLVWLHRRVANRLERKPRFIESGLQDDERLRIEGTIVEPAHGSIPHF